MRAKIWEVYNLNEFSNNIIAICKLEDGSIAECEIPEELQTGTWIIVKNNTGYGVTTVSKWKQVQYIGLPTSICEKCVYRRTCCKASAHTVNCSKRRRA